MHYFNSSFLRTYYGLGPDTNGDAIVYYCDLKKVLPWGFNQIWLLFIDLVFPFASFSPFHSSSAFPSASSLSSSVVSYSLGRGRISCSEVGWFLGGARRPESGLEPASLPPDTRRWNMGQDEGPYPRTELAARRRQESNPKGEPEGASPGHWASGLPKGQRPPRPPMVGMLGSGPGSGCPGDLSVTTASSKRARGTPDRTPVSPLASARSQIPGFASGESIKTRTGFGQIFLSRHERPAIECTLRGCVPTCFLIINSLGIIKMTHRPLWWSHQRKCGVDGRGQTGCTWAGDSTSRGSDSSLIPASQWWRVVSQFRGLHSFGLRHGQKCVHKSVISSSVYVFSIQQIFNEHLPIARQWVGNWLWPELPWWGV